MATRSNCSVDQLCFPVLCLSRDASIAVAENAERLERCNALAFFKTRYYDDLVICDSKGAQYRVSRFELATPLSGIKKWLIRAWNRPLMIVRLTVERERQGSLTTAKEHVLIWLNKDPGFWEECRDMAEWERRGQGRPGYARGYPVVCVAWPSGLTDRCSRRAAVGLREVADSVRAGPSC